MSAAVVLRLEAEAFGVRLRMAGDGRVKVGGDAPPELLARLRERKAELVGLLRGEACRCCGALLDARFTDALPFADGTAAHVACYEAAEVVRLHARAACCFSPEVLADEAELAMRGEALP